MTALTTAQSIARSIGLPEPTTLVSNPNQDARRMLQAINDAGRFLSRFEWQSQVIEVTASISTTDYITPPADFRSIVPMSSWQVGLSEPVQGPVRNVEWQAQRYGTIGTTVVNSMFHLRWNATSQRIYVSPAPANGDQFVYLYRSTGWVSSGGVIASVSADSDNFLLEGYLLECEAKWRFLKSIGQSYGEEKDEAERLRRIAMAEDGGMEEITAGMGITNIRWNYPDGDFG